MPQNIKDLMHQIPAEHMPHLEEFVTEKRAVWATEEYFPSNLVYKCLFTKDAGKWNQDALPGEILVEHSDYLIYAQNMDTYLIVRVAKNNTVWPIIEYRHDKYSTIKTRQLEGSIDTPHVVVAVDGKGIKYQSM